MEGENRYRKEDEFIVSSIYLSHVFKAVFLCSRQKSSSELKQQAVHFSNCL
jgi:hypothetical protein